MHTGRAAWAALAPAPVSPILCSLMQNGLGYSRNVTIPDYILISLSGSTKTVVFAFIS